jgi:hypothetical protein
MTLSVHQFFEGDTIVSGFANSVRLAGDKPVACSLEVGWQSGLAARRRTDRASEKWPVTQAWTLQPCDATMAGFMRARD